MEYPQWLVPFKDNPEWQQVFMKWVDDAVAIYAQRALFAANDVATLSGLRFAAGELLALKSLVLQNDEAIERERQLNEQTNGHSWAE